MWDAFLTGILNQPPTMVPPETTQNYCQKDDYPFAFTIWLLILSQSKCRSRVENKQIHLFLQATLDFAGYISHRNFKTVSDRGLSRNQDKICVRTVLFEKEYTLTKNRRAIRSKITCKEANGTMHAGNYIEVPT